MRTFFTVDPNCPEEIDPSENSQRHTNPLFIYFMLILNKATGTFFSLFIPFFISLFSDIPPFFSYPGNKISEKAG